jgi:hypothetical protein
VRSYPLGENQSALLDLLIAREKGETYGEWWSTAGLAEALWQHRDQSSAREMRRLVDSLARRDLVETETADGRRWVRLTDVALSRLDRRRLTRRRVALVKAEEEWLARNLKHLGTRRERLVAELAEIDKQVADIRTESAARVAALGNGSVRRD